MTRRSPLSPITCKPPEICPVGLDIASYAGSNIVPGAQAMEVFRVGSPDEGVTVRDLSGATKSAHFKRVSVTHP
jgi:hypothetical protein